MEEKNEKTKKKQQIIVGVIVAVVVAVIVIFAIMFTKDSVQEQKLRKEMGEISEITANINSEKMDMDEIDKKLNETITTGDYAIVEKAIKEYLSDSLNSMKAITEIMNDERISKVLTAENYKNDGPEFKETKEYLVNTQKTLELSKKILMENMTDEKVMAYIESKNVDTYYIDLYKELAIGEESVTEEDRKAIESSLDDIINVLQVEQEVIEFLVANKGKWEVEDENIVFEQDSLIQEYNELLGKI